MSSAILPRPQSPGHGPEHALVSGAHRLGFAGSSNAALTRPDIDLDLVVTGFPPSLSVHVETPFTLHFSLAVSVSRIEGPLGRTRVLKLAVQHVLPKPTLRSKSRNGEDLSKIYTALSPTDLTPNLSPGSGSLDAITPRRVLSPGPGTPGTSISRGLSSPELITSPSVASPAPLRMEPLAERLRNMTVDVGADRFRPNAETQDGDDFDVPSTVKLPAPYVDLHEDRRETLLQYADFVGSTVTLLSPILFPKAAQDSDKLTEQQFTLTYIALSRGFKRLCGLRVLLIDDSTVDCEVDEAPIVPSPATETVAQVLKEWNAVAEVWVT